MSKANGNGVARAAKDEYQKENIFLFWPNVIGRFYASFSACGFDDVQDMSESSLRSHHYTTCPCTRKRVPDCTVFHACWMRWMDMRHDTLINLRSSERFWTW